MPQKIKAVILDIDQTLTDDTGSWIEFTKLLGADFNIHKDIFQRYQAGQLAYEPAKKELIQLWRSASKLDRQSIQQIFDKIELRPGAFEAIKYLQTKYTLCLISGAIDLFVNIIGERLGIEDKYAATKFIFNVEDELIDFDYSFNKGQEKLAFLNDFLSKHNIDPQQCAAIGDGASDMPLFAKVGLPILLVAQETTEEQKLQIKQSFNNWKEIYKLL